MKNENVFQCMLRTQEEQLPADIEQRIIRQVDTLSILSRVVEIYGPNALDVASRYLTGQTENPGTGPQTNLNEDISFWRVKP